MKVISYIQMRRMIRPTGVGKHIIHMVAGLSKTEGMEVSVLADRKLIGNSSVVPPGGPLAGLPARSHYPSRFTLEKMWRYLGWPAVDHWAGDADWVYSPAEVYIPSRRVRVATTVHDVHFLEPDLPWSNSPEHLAQRPRWRKMLDRVLKHSQLILTVSEFSKSRILELLGGDAARIEIVGNGIDLAAASFPASAVRGSITTESAARGRYLAVVGGLSRRKGIQYVIPVAEALRKAVPGLRIVVAGGASALDHAGLPSNIELLGYLPEEELAGFLHEALALLFLSRYEGFGIPCLEAMGAGTPVIASHFAALPEIVGDAGIIVDPAKTDAVIDAIQSLLASADLREHYIRRGLQRVNGYTWDACVHRLADALRRHL